MDEYYYDEHERGTCLFDNDVFDGFLVLINRASRLRRVY